MAYLEEHRRRSAAEPSALPLAASPKCLGQRLRHAAPSALPWAIVAGALLLWEAGARLGLVSALLFPAPTTVAAAGWKLLLAGLLLAFNLSLLLTIAVEMISANDGLGWLLWRGWQVMRTEEVYVSLGLVVAIGVSANRLIHWLSRLVVPWQAERSSRHE